MGQAKTQTFRGCAASSLAATDKRVSGTAIQTVGHKGHDGLAVLLTTAAP
jgi:hypothetical protein